MTDIAVQKLRPWINFSTI